MRNTCKWSKSAWLCSLLVLACSRQLAAEPPPFRPLVVRHARTLRNKLMTVVVRDGRIAEVLPDDAEVAGETPANRFDAAGRWMLPAFIDSHVHAAYLKTIVRDPNRGVAGAVDLGMPVDAMGTRIPGLELLVAGPLLTASRGYPTQGWGSAGYGLEVAGPGEAGAVIEQLVAKNARVVKLAFSEPPTLDEATARAIVEAAHARGLKVAAHALTDAHAALAARVGCDVLAHTPVEPLAEATFAAWSAKAVISTLAAFGGGGAAIANLHELRARGATVMYGTDFGNSTAVGIQNAEVFALLRAGFDMSAIVDAATRVPAAYWGFDGLGAVAVGQRASFFFTADSPIDRPDTLAVPIRVFIDGGERRP
ncbi:MAG: amidohydrolase family protein [Myxococcota bacterium]